MRTIGTMLIAGLALAGCGKAAEPTKVPAEAVEPASAVQPAPAVIAAGESPPPTDAWVGKWVGVEGLALDVAMKPDAVGAVTTAPRYDLTITLMDGTSRYDGTAQGDTIAFVRDGQPQTLRHVAGAETGLKWLAEKTDCLVVQSGEGFCRD